MRERRQEKADTGRGTSKRQKELTRVHHDKAQEDEVTSQFSILLQVL